MSVIHTIYQYFIIYTIMRGADKYQPYQTRCKQLKMVSFIPLLKEKLELYGDLVPVRASMADFVTADDTFNDQKWSFFKLMMSFDLFSLLDILYLNGKALYDYIDSIYEPYHITSLRLDSGQGQDDPQKIVEFIIDEGFRKSRACTLLQMVVGHHLDIKEESLMSLHFSEEKLLKKYDTIKKIVKEIHTIILKRHMRSEDFNDQILNDENKFLAKYSQTTQAFKASCENFITLLEYEEMCFEFQETAFVFNGRDDGARDERALRMLNMVATVQERYKQKPQPVVNVPQQRPTRIITGLSRRMPDAEYELLFKIFLKEYSDNHFETLQLIKFSMVKHLFQKVNIRHRDVEIFTHLLKLKLFSVDVISLIWNNLRQPTIQLVENVLLENPGDLEFTLAHCTFSKNSRIPQLYASINNIFKEVDLFIASQICGSWKERTQISNKIKILAIGETKAGKSSLYNFLTRCPSKELMEVGNNHGSFTFYPKAGEIDMKIRKQVNGVTLEAEETVEWWDLPGLADTRPFVFKLCIGFFLKTIVESSSHSDVRFVYVHQNTNIFNLRTFPGVVKLLGNILQWDPRKISSCMLVLSKVATRQSGQMQFDNEVQGMIQEIYPQYVEGIVPVHGVSTSLIQDFFRELVSQINQKTEYFSMYDNTNLTQESQSRGNILQMIKGLEPSRGLEMRPIVFLEKNEASFLQAFDVEYKAKKYLSPLNKQPGHLFLRIFEIIRTFRVITEDRIRQEYNSLKDKLKTESEHGIHDFFVKLNEINNEENIDKNNKNKKSQITSNVIHDILMYHLKSYFVPFKEIVVERLNAVRLDKNLMEQIAVLTTLHKLNANPQFKVDLETTIGNAVGEDQKPQIVERMTTLVNEESRGFKSEKEQVEMLLKYLKLLVVSKDNHIQFLVNNSLGDLKQLENNLAKFTTLKPEYKKVFLIDSNRRKFNKFLKLKRNNPIELTLIQCIEEVATKDNKFINSSWAEPRMMVEYFLELLSKENYNTNLILDHKYSHMFSNEEVKNTSKFLRLNFHGECIHKEVQMSSFLKINAVGQKGRLPTDQTIYVFSQHSHIKVFCTKFIFDMRDVKIRCKGMFSIIADQIELKHQSVVFQAYKFDHNSATVVVEMRKGELEKKQSLRNRLLIPPPRQPELQLDSQNQNILTYGYLVSRTEVNSGIYSELYYLDPRFVWNMGHTDSSRIERQIFRKKEFTGARLHEFGQLHLTNLVQNKLEHNLHNGNIGLPNKASVNKVALNRQQVQAISLISQSVIEYIRDKFSRTTLRLQFDHFNTLFCQKMSIVIVEKVRKEGFDCDLTALKHDCYRYMKEQLFSHIYNDIIQMLKTEYYKQYGSHITHRKIQSESFEVKKYCEDLLQMSLQKFELQHQSQTFNGLTQKINSKFQKNIFNTARNTFFNGLIRVFKVASNYFGGVKETEQDRKVKLKYDPDFVKTTISRLQRNQRFLLNEHRSYDKKLVDEGSSDNSQLEQEKTQQPHSKVDYEERRNQARMLCKECNFSGLIAKYHAENTIFSGKQDIIHSYLGFAFMKGRQYKEAENEFKLLPSEIENSDPNKIVFDVLKKKYESVFRGSQQGNSTENNLIQGEMYQAMRKPFDEQLVSSSKRYSDRDRGTFNILSFDSALHLNHIVNIIFAAEIQKCTHRPIMHMFDMIVCKNSSALIGTALTIPRRTERDNTYGIKLLPQFKAYDFIKESKDKLEKLDYRTSIKIKFQDFDFRGLSTALAIVDQQQHNTSIISTFNYSKHVGREFRTIYDIVHQTVKNKWKGIQVNPLVDVYKDEHVHALRSQREIGIVSLGSGINVPKVVENWTPERCKSYDRWQMYLDNEIKMQVLKVDDYIELTRMELQERWVNKTKEMRDLMDKLEDRTTLKSLQEW